MPSTSMHYDTNASAVEMAETIFGDGVTVVGATYTGDDRSSAIYDGGSSLGLDILDTGVILSTGLVTNFTNSGGGGTNQYFSTSSNTKGIDNNPLFDALAGTDTYDASWLDVDFIPETEMMTMSFVFTSEDYINLTTSDYLDMIGIWVNGELIETTIGDISVTGVNGTTNENLFIENSGTVYPTEMDGLTVTLSVSFVVNPNEVNSIRIGIADVGNSSNDSTILIMADSVQGTLIAMDDTIAIPAGDSATLDVLGNEINLTGGTLSVTHINGVPVSPGDSVTLPSGEVVTLNPDWTFSITTDGVVETDSFTYTVASSTGDTDVGFVTVSTVPCFVAGTLIDTPQGPRLIESLRVGDLVTTLDNGAQPIRWIGTRHVAAEGRFAPIRIRKGRFGATRDLLVSPQHRVLVRDPLAALFFGEAEVLVAAKDLVDGHQITIEEGGQVTYLHILFDSHQVIYSEGLATESFLPGPQVLSGMEAEVQAEICALFPELDPQTGAGYGPAARHMLRSYEARLLVTEAA
ncbi:Hint domain-containing protein [Pseudothioclava arenosa]|nr:Hint domain-containing protein [Pseudothioclava arenosa]